MKPCGATPPGVVAIAGPVCYILRVVPSSHGAAHMSVTPVRRPYEIVDFTALPPVECPCGQARRGFVDVGDFPGTIHVTEIGAEARRHYHQRLTETYYVLECELDAHLLLDDDIIPLRPGLCVMIRPGTRHQAVGHMKVLIVVIPKFDPLDEWFD